MFRQNNMSLHVVTNVAGEADVSTHTANRNKNAPCTYTRQIPSDDWSAGKQPRQDSSPSVRVTKKVRPTGRLVAAAKTMIFLTLPVEEHIPNPCDYNATTNS